MTYCVGIEVNEGLVFAADTRTSASFDDVRVYRKMHVFEWPGDRVFVIMSAGNLATTQLTISRLQRDADNPDATRSLRTFSHLYEVAEYVGDTLVASQVKMKDEAQQSGVNVQSTLILGGQIAGEGMRLFLVYSAGNFIEATAETPYFQIGESKYGKPVLDRVLTPETPLDEAAKCALVSMDSTLKSNLSVGLPLDLVVYEVDQLQSDRVVCIDQDNPYFTMLHKSWGQRLREVFDSIEDPQWNGGATEVPLRVPSARHPVLKKITQADERVI